MGKINSKKSLLYLLVVIAGIVGMLRLQSYGLSRGDDHSDGNSLMAGRNFAKQGFFELGFIPSTQPQVSAGKELYPNYPQGADLMSGMIQSVFPKDNLFVFRTLMLGLSLATLVIFWFFLLEVTKSEALALVGALLLLFNPIQISLLDSLHQTPYTSVFVALTLYFCALLLRHDAKSPKFRNLILGISLVGFFNAWFTYETIVGLFLVPALVLFFLKREPLKSVAFWSLIVGIGPALASLIRLGIASAHFGGPAKAVGYFLELAKERSLSGVERENMLTFQNWIDGVVVRIFETAFAAPFIVVLSCALLLWAVSLALEEKRLRSVLAWMGICLIAGASWYFLMPAHTVAHSGLSFIHRHLLVPSVLFWLAVTMGIAAGLAKAGSAVNKRPLFNYVCYVPVVLVMVSGFLKSDLLLGEAAQERNREFDKLAGQLRETGSRIDPSWPGATNYLRRPFLSYYSDRNVAWLNGPKEYLEKGRGVRFFLLVPYQTPEVQELYNNLLEDGFSVSERLENGYLPIIVLKK
jgi:hypothetical protein